VSTLGRHARRVIAERGVTVGEYLAHVYGSPTGGWHGDRCGCPDDRCGGGYHHDGGDDACGCLPAVLDQMLGENARVDLAAAKTR
jgi:hypothetical protein